MDTCSQLSCSLTYKEWCSRRKGRVGPSGARDSEQGQLLTSTSSITSSSQTGDRIECLELVCGKRETVCPSKEGRYNVPEEGDPVLLHLLNFLNKTRNLFLFYFKPCVRKRKTCTRAIQLSNLQLTCGLKEKAQNP